VKLAESILLSNVFVGHNAFMEHIYVNVILLKGFRKKFCNIKAFQLL